jgi:hypothetical protein
MTEQSAEPQSEPTESPLGGGGEGVDVTSGEPNTFEPEEDPDAAPTPSQDA